LKSGSVSDDANDYDIYNHPKSP